MTDIQARNDFIEVHYRNNFDRLVRRFAGRVGEANAQDLVQDAYCRALMYWGSFDENEGPFDHWFARVCENAKTDVLNDDIADEFDGTQVDFIKEMAVPPTQEKYVELRDIEAMLKDERPDHRRALILVLLLGHSHEDAAKETALEANNVKLIVHRFREKIA